MIPIAEPAIGGEEVKAVEEVLRSGQLADGPEVRAFEREFATACETEHAVATSNGTTALHAAIAGLDLGPGDHIVTSPFTFIATANAARLAGCDVSFVDIDPNTYTLDLDHLEERLRDGEDIDAVIAVHLYGLPPTMDRLVELADTYDFDLIEDAAQAHGAKFDDTPVGSFGDVGCFSFYPTKNMTTGEGGMVMTDRSSVADRVASFIDHGRLDGYHHGSVGHNFRMTSLAAAIGRIQLERLPEFLKVRRRNARRYDEALADLPVETPHVPADRTHAYNQYTIKCTQREQLRERLSEADIATGIYYPRPIYRQPAYDEYEATAPVTERACERVLSLPVHPGVDEPVIDKVASEIARSVGVTS